MNWPPIAIRQQNKLGLNEPTPDVLTACWESQTVGLVFPPVSGVYGAVLRFTVPDDEISRQIAASVELCDPISDFPSAWEVVHGELLRVSDLEPGASVDVGLPVLGLFSGGVWGVRLKSIEYRPDNLKLLRDSATIELTFAPTPEPDNPVSGPYSQILNGIGATADDRINVIVRQTDSAQRRVVLDIAGDTWVAMVADEGKPLVTYEGEV